MFLSLMRGLPALQKLLHETSRVMRKANEYFMCSVAQMTQGCLLQYEAILVPEITITCQAAPNDDDRSSPLSPLQPVVVYIRQACN